MRQMLLAGLLWLSALSAWAQPSVVCHEYGIGSFGDPSTHPLATCTPSAGNTLVVVGYASTAVDIGTLTDDDANSYTEDFNGDTGRWSVMRLSDIPAGIASLSWDLPSNTQVHTFVLEVSSLDDTSPLNDTSAYASDGDGFVTSHGFEYTTTEANELVVAAVRPNAARVTTGTNGATSVNTSSIIAGVVFEVVASAETADITWDFDTAASADALLVSYLPAAGGGNTSLRRRRN